MIIMSYYSQQLIEFYKKKKTSQFDKKVQSLIVCIIFITV